MGIRRQTFEIDQAGSHWEIGPGWRRDRVGWGVFVKGVMRFIPPTRPVAVRRLLSSQ